jgi:hypothetical protein
MYCSEGDSDREVSGGAATVTLREKVAFLSEPCAFGGLARSVQPRETHTSWVFLAGDFVFKLKKPVRFPYLEFSTVLKRHAACRAEVALNKRLAPGVYLGVVPLCNSKKGLALGEGGEVIDWKSRSLIASNSMQDLGPSIRLTKLPTSISSASIWAQRGSGEGCAECRSSPAQPTGS